MRRVAQAPSHYEIELRQDDHQGERTGTSWRAIKHVLPNGSAQPLTFPRLEAAQAYARRMNLGQARIVAVKRNGWRRTVDAAET